MHADRASIEAESLLRIVLALVVVWLVLEVVGEILELFTFVVGLIRPLLGLLVLALIALWLFDRL